MSLVKQTSVSKRNSRPFVEPDMEKSAELPQETRTTRQEEVGPEGNDRASSTSTSATQSIQASPVIRPIEGLQDVDVFQYGEYGWPGRFPTDIAYWDPFHPRNPKPNWRCSTVEHEKSLPVEGRPANFGVVVPGVYRSSFPQSKDYGFIETLGLKTIV